MPAEWNVLYQDLVKMLDWILDEMLGTQILPMQIQYKYDKPFINTVVWQ